MKTLLLLRHAKSDWDDPDLEDHERPLDKRGKKDAPRMGRLMRAEKLVPDLIITSTARRAVDTVEALVAENQYGGEVQQNAELYGAGSNEYLQLLRGLPDDHRSVMLVGHNPTMEEFLGQLTGSETSMPTAALALVELPVEKWAEVGEETSGTLKQVWRPKEMS